jgi:hypothetical protein
MIVIQQIVLFNLDWVMEIMYDIEIAKKMENGIVVFYHKKEEKKYESFNFQELIDLKINSLDLLEHPNRYSVDVEVHKVYFKDD